MKNDKKVHQVSFFSISLLIILLFFCSTKTSAKEIKTTIKVPEEYIVRERDNLWELSQKQYKDPYKWRSIWNKNQYIDNPDLIYPGDIIYLPGKFRDHNVVEIIPDKIEKKVETKMSLPKAVIPPPAPKSELIVSESVYNKSGYIISGENWAGKIIQGPAERTIFGKGDSLYVDIGKNNASLKEQFFIVDKLRQIKHPVTGKIIGNLIQELGIIEVNEVRDDNSSSLVIKSFGDIEVGDLLARFEDSKPARRDPLKAKKSKEVNGFIIAGKEERDTYGQGSIVYFDVGKNQGVEIGDHFIAYKGGSIIGDKGLFGKGKQISLPETVLGEIEVFKVRKDTSTAVVRQSVKEISLGANIKYKTE